MVYVTSNFFRFLFDNSQFQTNSIRTIEKLLRLIIVIENLNHRMELRRRGRTDYSPDILLHIIEPYQYYHKQRK